MTQLYLLEAWPRLKSTEANSYFILQLYMHLNKQDFINLRSFVKNSNLRDLLSLALKFETILFCKKCHKSLNTKNHEVKGQNHVLNKFRIFDINYKVVLSLKYI